MCVCFQIQPFLFFPPSAKGTISFLLFLLSVFFILLSSVSSPPSSLCSSLPLLSFRLLLHFSSSCIFSSLPLLHSFLLPSPIFSLLLFLQILFFILAAFPPLILSLPLFLSWLFHVTLSSYFLSFYCSSPHSFLLPVFFLFLFRIFSQCFFVTTVVVILFNM